MADVINLNKARKTRDRQDAKAQAAANRAKFGQDRAAKDAARREDRRAARDLDGKKIED
ncbi:DUF4169 family protein [Ferrovibrio sp.]|uniref:DUF4169 family protein n=1 Tax=Ferrovibrio sp. TaxID=1917215 RepID=UPI00311E0E81